MCSYVTTTSSQPVMDVTTYVRERKEGKINPNEVLFCHISLSSNVIRHYSNKSVVSKSILLLFHSIRLSNYHEFIRTFFGKENSLDGNRAFLDIQISSY